MACTTRPLHDHQRRALAAAAGLVGRPRLRAGLALTLAFACGPMPDDGTPGVADDAALTDAASTLALTTDDATSTSLDEASTTTTGTTGTTLLTDAGTTLATDTGDSSTNTTGSTGELDDCVLDRRTMEMDWACCEAQGWQPVPQCTPWGPPAPPAADRLLQARAARQVLA